jgi:sigma-B regulation protein RsbU (phosphoserine phosphatase)
MKPARILVVDDEPGMLRAVERVLAPRHRVLTAATSSEALSSAPGFHPDLAILDIRMPDLDGFELMRLLRRDRPDLDVILMTGSMGEPDRKLIRALREKAFYFVQKPFDIEVLLTLVDRCLDLRRLEEENLLHTRRLERELAEARAFQESLLPHPEAVVEGLSLACRCLPCSELGGDLCDYIRVGPGRVAVLVADVSGHGASGAMMTGIVKSAFHAVPREGFDPRAVVDRIALGIGSLPPERFITVFCASVDLEADRIDYVNAGHPPAIVWSGAEPGLRVQDPLDPTGPLLSSAFAGAAWLRRTVPFGPGNRLLVHTDGITEARIGDGFFGEAGILEVIGTAASGGGELLDRILGRIHESSGGRAQPDDLTLLLAERPR